MRAGSLLRHARRRTGLTQQALAERTGMPQSMVSAIEAGRQDPRHGTLDRLLRICGYELDLVHRGGEGVDRTMFVENLRHTPEERLRRARAAALSLDRLVRSARRV